MFKEINPAPGQMLSLYEAMAKYTGSKCPVVVGAPSKLIKRGIMEQESWKRVSIRKVTEMSTAFQNAEINFSFNHDMDINTSTYGKDGRVAAFSCEMCTAEQPNPTLSNMNRTMYYCIQCSIFAHKPCERVYLHPQSFGKYHRQRYQGAFGSSNVKGLVVGR